MTTPSLALVVVAAGSGTRFGGPKQWAPLAGRPLLAHCLDALSKAHPDAERIVVLPGDLLDSAQWMEVEASLAHRWRGVVGGATRALSVRAGVEAASTDLVAVHDGARPFPPIDALREALARLQANANLAGAIVSSAVTDTLKRLDDDGATIMETVDRNRFARAETPQVCRRPLLLEALSRPGADACTDEGQTLEAAGHATAAVIHRGHNPKITTPADLVAAGAWLRRQ